MLADPDYSFCYDAALGRLRKTRGGRKKRTSGAKARAHFSDLAARVNSCPSLFRGNR